MKHLFAGAARDASLVLVALLVIAQPVGNVHQCDCRPDPHGMMYYWSSAFCLAFQSSTHLYHSAPPIPEYVRCR